MNDDGATAIEYGLIAGLISVGIIAAVTAVSTSVQTNLYSAIEALVVG